jgi:tetratricopeptide (TPR) repeat protein
MYNLLISTGAAVVTMLVLFFGVGLSWWVALLISLPVLMICFILISRVVMKKIEAVMGSAMRDLNSPKAGATRERQLQLMDKAIRDLQEAFKYAKWQIYAEGQVNSSIGMLYYIKRDFAAAFPYLEKGFFKNWVTMGMLAISYMKRQKREKMREIFDKAVVGSPKESLLYALYAYCLLDGGDREKAQSILEKGLKKIPGDENLEQNLALVKDGKKMKMTGYGEMWYQFHLENLAGLQKTQLQQATTGGMKRRMVRR